MLVGGTRGIAEPYKLGTSPDVKIRNRKINESGLRVEIKWVWENIKEV